MKISEMNKCIAAMRDCYNFKDDETEIRLVNTVNYEDKYVYISTKDKNGTRIEMSKCLDEIKDNK
jgi:hypothetical protein